MTAATIVLAARPPLAARIVRSLCCRRGSLEWDAAIRGTAAMALLAIPAVLWLPRTGELVVFLLATIWCHGPLSPLLPATFEPVLMHFGRLYPPLVIALLGTVANVYVEFFNYRLYGGVMRMEALERMNGAVERGRLMRWFAWSPFFAVWFGTVTPIPDWLGRIVASVAAYPQGRYLLAFGLGRFPRFLLFASLGAWLSLNGRVVLAVTVATIVVTGAVAVVKWRGGSRNRRRGAARCAPTIPGSPY